MGNMFWEDLIFSLNWLLFIRTEYLLWYSGNEEYGLLRRYAYEKIRRPVLFIIGFVGCVSISGSFYYNLMPG